MGTNNPESGPEVDGNKKIFIAVFAIVVIIVAALSALYLSGVFGTKGKEVSATPPGVSAHATSEATATPVALTEKEQTLKSEIELMLQQEFPLLTFEGYKKILEYTQLNYSAEENMSKEEFMKIEGSLAKVLRNSGYQIKSTFSVGQGTMQIGGKSISTPAQIQIDSIKQGSEIIFKIEKMDKKIKVEIQIAPIK